MQDEKDLIGLGATPSHYDPQTAQHVADMSVAPLLKGGVIYQLSDIDNQWYEGICTAISFTQNRTKKTGKKYSPDFQYLLQKKYFDMAWYEGSSIFTALKVGYNFGLLPAELWNHTTIEDRKLPYAQYIAKLQSIPDAEIQRLLKLCVDKIGGYAQVDISTSQTIAKAISDSQVGILCRFEVGPEWYSPSNPLLAPTSAADIIGAHAIGMTYFDYTVNLDQKLANTWGVWGVNKDGNADVYFNTYKPSEAWIILDAKPVLPPAPTMKTVILTRQSDNGKETLGTLSVDSFNCYTIERPWLNNNRNISCIPKGTYKCVWAYMGTLKEWHYQLQGVTSRSGIFIHEGNYFFNSDGCIIVGNAKADINHDGQIDVLNSRVTLAKFESYMNKMPFMLIIK